MALYRNWYDEAALEAVAVMAVSVRIGPELPHMCSIRIINKLIRGMTNGEFEPKDFEKKFLKYDKEDHIFRTKTHLD